MTEPTSLRDIVARTVGHYERSAVSFREGTRDHDVSQNIAALIDALDGAQKSTPPYRILDLGCGPGRDLAAFRDLGHQPIGLEASPTFCEMAREHSGCAVLQQDFLALDLRPRSFDGVFANASLFHVPTRELPRVLGELYDAVVDQGVLFASNPRGRGEEGWNGDRYGSWLSFEHWRDHGEDAGFELLRHYYRPPDRPRAQQPWLAMVWRRR